ncbi:reverse transcriptase domain-containing protein [Tanacetum coccineum]
MEALTTKIDSQYKTIKEEMKEMQDGCSYCGGPHPSSECDEKPMGGPKDEEANYAYGGYGGGGYRGNYYGWSSGNWQDHQPSDENRNSQPREDAPFVPPTPKKKFDESDFEKTMREFMDLKIKFGQISDSCSTRPIGLLLSNTQTNPKPSPMNDKPYRPPSAQKEHVNAVFTRSGLTYNLSVNPNANTTVIHDDSDEEVDKTEKEVEPSSSKQTKSDPPPLKAYKPKIPYPQRLRSVEYLALADLSVSINLIPYSLYGSLSGNTLKPSRMSIRLANHTYQYPMGIVENMLIQVGKFGFPADFVILQMEDDDEVPLILGRPFLHTADAIIQVQFRRTSLTGFPAQSVRSSNTIALDSPYLLVLITRTSQSRQHESRKSPTTELFDVDSGRISIHHCEY